MRSKKKIIEEEVSRRFIESKGKFSTSVRSSTPNIKVNKNSIIQLMGSWNSVHLLLLFFLSIIGLLLRLEPVFSNTVHFSYDQGVDLSFVRQLVEDHKLSLIGRFTGLQGLFMGPFWTWILALPFLFSGGDPAANVIFFSLIGTAFIWITYFITQDIVDKQTAMITSTYVALSGSFISASQIVLSPHPIMYLMIFYIWFLWQILEKNNPKYLIYLGLLAGIFFQFEIGFTIFLIPATLIALLTLGGFKKIAKSHIFISIFLFLLTFLPQIIFEFRHDFLMTKAVSSYLSGENTSLGKQGESLLDRINIRLDSLTEDYSTSISFGQDNYLITIILTIPALLGLRSLIKKNKSRLKLFLILTFLIVGIYFGFIIYPGPVWVWYRVGLPILFVLIIASGWSELIINSKAFKTAAVIIFSFCAFVGIKPKTIITRFVYGYEGEVASLKNQKQALDIVFIDAGDDSFDLYIYTPPVYTYVWDHLLFWYTKNKYTNHPEDYGYQRTKFTSNNYYLLIEPDEIQASIDGWKGNFVDQSQLMRKWDLPGGITIEKWRTIKN